MAWTLKGTWYESCSCELFCPCNLGPAKPTQEWCSGLFAFAVDSGESNGVDLGGTRFALHAELPGDFFGGIDRALIYLNESTSSEQQGELEAIVQGKRGGVWEGIAGMIREFLPSKTTKVEVTGGESPRVERRWGSRHHHGAGQDRGRQAHGGDKRPLFPGFAMGGVDLIMGPGRRSATAAPSPSTGPSESRCPSS
ncbi:MAG TPA: DUF1326 domain-containing protein [Acidimicrobiales bacterium]|nr:DUF1326 domain-containing protein [Acidimicrobiales bacterium]